MGWRTATVWTRDSVHRNSRRGWRWARRTCRLQDNIFEQHELVFVLNSC